MTERLNQFEQFNSLMNSYELGTVIKLIIVILFLYTFEDNSYVKEEIIINAEGLSEYVHYIHILF